MKRILILGLVVIAIVVVGCAKSRAVEPGEHLCARVFLSESTAVVTGVALKVPTKNIGRGIWIIQQADGAVIKIPHRVKHVDAWGTFPCADLLP